MAFARYNTAQYNEVQYNGRSIRAARISWAEVEVPEGARRARFSWAEVEVPTAPDPNAGGNDKYARFVRRGWW